MTDEPTSGEPTASLGFVRNVLVPLDGSEFALQALPTARALTNRFSARLHTISVINDDEEARRVRALAAAAVRVEPDDDRVTVVRDADPAAAIARRAAELDSSVVCMTTNGRGRFHGAVVGSVARSVLLASERPLVALGPFADNPGWTPRPRLWPEPLSTRRIIACVDGSPASEQILEIAATWARALDMSLTITTVTGDELPPIRTGQGKSQYGPHSGPDDYIGELVEGWRGSVPEIDGRVLRDPISPAGGIRQHLQDQPASLVALTSHARSGMQRALLGATAASIGPRVGSAMPRRASGRLTPAFWCVSGGSARLGRGSPGCRAQRTRRSRRRVRRAR